MFFLIVTDIYAQLINIHRDNAVVLTLINQIVHSGGDGHSVSKLTCLNKHTETIDTKTSNNIPMWS